MAVQKPSLARGTRDFGPVQMARRNYLFDIIKGVFQKFGFQPVETPAIENLSTLTGKYGEEGDQLLFKILDSGDYFSKYRDKSKMAHGTRLTELLKGAFIKFSQLVWQTLPEKFETSEDILKDKLISDLDSVVAAKSDNEDRELVETVRKFILDYRPSFLNTLKNIEDGNTASLDDLVFRIENIFRTDKVSSFRELLFEKYLALVPTSKITFEISEKGLRYDLTVPFARYVVMNQNDITFPFKRYQVQPVWRADRPQRGRYREFYQCDADVIGTNSLLCEAEIVLMIAEVFKKLKLADYSIKLNNRKVLSGMVEVMGAPGQEGALCVAIDKLDKIGEEKVFEELQNRGFSPNAVSLLKPFLALSGSNENILQGLKTTLANSQIGTEGVNELAEVLEKVNAFGTDVPQLAIDPALARGLSYYTGCIFEVKPTSVQMGSICGGGRYDNLTGVFGLPGVSGVGISFGIDRMYDVLDELQLFPAASLQTTKVLIANFDEASAAKAMALLAKLREAGISAELYPDAAKLKKQFTYAENKRIPYLLMAGEAEFEAGKFGLKDIQSGVQEAYTVDQLISKLR